ncbi:FAD-dependent oxidoreductase [Allorhizobium ampelinum]|uniref:FAD-dependent oxidoreductase n=1 Tax=Allorhizobium ampelinum TaxID=3025782 RepID=UPI000B406903|nr:FAD-dependent oxidoreductase [Allorhizobium ampelinum]NTA27379.1 FAD-dependent oxidoreductase [Allorhizobium ampelinum]OVE94435.1 hypothetical protein B7W85_12860 [Allorhizobium ampelinum]
MASVSSILAGGSVTLSAALSSSTALTGSVTFSDNGTPVGTVGVSSGTAALSVSNVTAGAHAFSARYNGDTTNGKATTAQSVTANASVLPDFAYHASSIAWFSAVNARLTAAGLAVLSRREKYHADRVFKRLDAQGLLSGLTSLQVYAAPAQTSSARQKVIAYSDWINTSLVATEVGTMTATLDTGLTPSTASSYINTGVAANAVGLSNFSFMLMINKLDTETYSAGTAAVAGALNSSGSGISIVPYTTSTGAITARANTTSASAASGSASFGGGLFVVCRPDSSSFIAYRNGKQHTTVSAASETQATGNIYIGALNNNETASTSSTGYRYSAFSYGAAMTKAQQKQYHAIIRSYVDSVQYGLVDIYEAGTNPTSVTADIVVYGLTSIGVAAAYEAKRQGKTVIMVGGWRDHIGNLGGMMAGGLGYTDFDNAAGLSGLSKWILGQIQTKAGVSTDYFNCRHAGYTFKQLLDPNKLSGLDIPVYLTAVNSNKLGGVVSVSKTGTVINSFITADGRRFTGKYFIDASYEGDLMSLSGVTYKVGREAGSTGEEGMNGWRGTSTSYNEATHQLNFGGTLVTVDPYNTAGDSTSGRIYGVAAWPTSTTGGQADYTTYNNRTVITATTGQPMTQAYNFRMMMATSLPYQTDEDWATTPPANYFSGEFEVLYRLIEAGTAASLTMNYVGGILKADSVGTGAYDVNSQGGISTDFWFGSWTYPEASYSDREAIWQAHMQREFRLFYAHRNESRITSGLRTAAQSYTFHNENFLDQFGNDPLHMSSQLYVREARRMVSDFIVNANDLTLTDGSTLRSNKTIALASYAMDSHHMGQYVHPSVSKVWNEGGFLRFGPGGSDQLSPIPYDAIIPKASECTNLTVIFSISSTHCAFGSIRMEFTAMMLGQAAAMASAIAIEAGNIPVQSVSYTGNATDSLNLRSRLLASNTNSGETQPLLPQVA